MDEAREMTVAEAYKENAARDRFLVYTDWNRNAHVVMDIRPASATTWNREEHVVPALPPASLTFEIICADGVLDRAQGDEVLINMQQRKDGTT